MKKKIGTYVFLMKFSKFSSKIVKIRWHYKFLGIKIFFWSKNFVRGPKHFPRCKPEWIFDYWPQIFFCSISEKLILGDFSRISLNEPKTMTWSLVIGCKNIFLGKNVVITFFICKKPSDWYFYIYPICFQSKVINSNVHPIFGFSRVLP